MRRSATALMLAGIGFAGSASAMLIDRGGGLIYDDTLNITWLQDANYAQTSGYDDDGLMIWFKAKAWAANLSYYDSVRNVTWTDWRLPYASVIAGAGPNTLAVNCRTATELQCRDNEMGYMFYYDLDGVFGIAETGDQIEDGVTLNNIQPGYWSGTENIPDRFNAWRFKFSNGDRFPSGRNTLLSAWAVRPGDVGAVPEPATVALLGLGLAGLGFSRRRKSVQA